MAARINRKNLLALAIAATVGAAPLGHSLYAANGSWTGGGANANWTTVGNWSAVPGNSATAINGSSADSSVATFNAAIANTWGLVGSPVIIDSASENLKSITFTGAAGNYFIGGTGANNPLYLTTGGVIQIDGSLSNLVSNVVTETINAPLVIEGANGSYTILNLSANGTAAKAGILDIGGTIGGGAAGVTALTLGGGNINANTVSGAIGDGLATHLNLVKSGTTTATNGMGLALGQWILTANNGYTGSTNVTFGTLSLAGGSGGILGTSSITVGGLLFSQTTNSTIGATLLLDNSVSNNNDRIAGDVRLTFNGELNLTGNGNISSTTESLGNLIMDAGAGTVTISNPGAATLHTLDASGFSRVNSATGVIRGTNLGNGTVNSTRFILDSTAGITQIGTNTSASGVSTGAVTNLTIVPFLVGNISATGTEPSNNFLTYDTTSGFRVLGANEQVSLGTSAAGNDTAIGASTDLNVKVSQIAAVLSSSAHTFNSLVIALNASGGSTGSLTGGGGALTISSGASLDDAQATSAINDTLGGFSTITFGNDEAVIHKATGSSLTISSPIQVTGGGGLVKGGSGNVNLDAVNLYTGPTTINQGTLTIGNSFTGNSNGSLDPTGTITVKPQGVLALAMSDGGVLANPIVITDTGITANNGTIGLGSILKQVGSGVNTLTGNISGTGGITIGVLSSNSLVAGNVLSFAGTTKTYLGPTNIQNSVLRVVGDVMSTSSALNFIPNATTANPTLQLRWDDNLLFHSGAATFLSAATQARSITIDVGPVTTGVTGRTLTLAGTLTITGIAPANGNATTLNVTGAAGYTLGLQALAPASSSDGNAVSVNVSGAALSIGAINEANSINFNFVGTGNSAVTGNMSLTSTNRTLTLTQSGAGALTLSGSAVTTTAAGGYVFALSGGTLNVNSDTALGNGTGTYSRTVNLSGGTLDNSDAVAHTATGNPGVNVNNDFVFGGTKALNLGTGATSLGAPTTPTTVRTITTNGSTEALTLGGVITAGTAIGLTKAGPGTLILTGTSPALTISTLVTGGTLIVGVGGVGSLGGAITVNAGTLGGSGSTTGAVIIGNGSGSGDAMISPGNSPGTFTTASTLTFASDGAYNYEINTTATAASDNIVASGVIIDGSALFSFNSSGDESGLSDGEVFTIIDNTGDSAIGGTFFNLSDGSSFTSGSFSYTASYSGGSGNDLTLTVSAVDVPEPASMGILGLGVMGLLMRRRREM